MGIPEEAERDKGTEYIFEAIMTENSLSYRRYQTTDPESSENTKWDTCKTKQNYT